MPVPSSRTLWLAALSLAPAAAALLSTGLAPLLIAFDLALLMLIGVDFALAPKAAVLDIRRVVEPVLSAGRVNVVKLELTVRAGHERAVSGEFRDWVTPGPKVEGHRQRFQLSGSASYVWKLTPSTRGDLQFGPLTLILDGPLGLCSRRQSVALPQAVRVFPDLLALTRDALTLAQPQSDAASRLIRIRSEGLEFESLREFRPGDDRRSIDWKATARRGKTLVRQHQPERNQQVLILLDCGRHMAGEVDGRRKLDHAVDTALRLAKVALDRGDLVGVLAFGPEVQRWLPPGKGAEHLRGIARALYQVDAVLRESNYQAAVDRAFAQRARRSLVIVLTDLLDQEAATTLHFQVRRLVPRHLPMIVSLQDEAVHQSAVQIPVTASSAYERTVAARLEREGAATVAKLREAGARVVRGTPSQFARASVNAYLDIKARGEL